MHFYGVNAASLLGSIFAKDLVLLLIVLLSRYKTHCVAENGINCYWMAGQIRY